MKIKLFSKLQFWYETKKIDFICHYHDRIKTKMLNSGIVFADEMDPGQVYNYFFKVYEDGSTTTSFGRFILWVFA